MLVWWKEKRFYMYMCVCCSVLRNTIARNRQLVRQQRQGDKLPQGVNTARTLYISNYFVTNI